MFTTHRVVSINSSETHSSITSSLSICNPVWWEQGSTFMSSWPSDVTALWVETRRTARLEEIEPDDGRSKTWYHEHCRSDHHRVLQPPEHLQGKWSLLGCLGSAVFHAPWILCDLCASGAVITLPGPADLCLVSGDIATVKCLQDWSCGSHISPKHWYLRVTCESRRICHKYCLFRARDQCKQDRGTLTAVKDCCAIVSQASHGRTVRGVGLWSQRTTLWSLWGRLLSGQVWRAISQNLMSKLRRQTRPISLLGLCLKMAAMVVVELGQRGNWIALDSIFREGRRNLLLSPKVRRGRRKQGFCCGKYWQKNWTLIWIYFCQKWEKLWI